MPKIEKKKASPYVENLNYIISSINLYEKIGKIEEEEYYDNLYGVVNENNLLDAGNKIDNILGIAIDIGTTGISYYLVDLQDGTVINRVSSLNPQTEFGGDVLTRITYCMNNENGCKELKDTIIKEINKSINKIIGNKYTLNDIYNVVIAGNTTMMHLVLGVSPISLSKAPYRPVFLNYFNSNAYKLGININKNGIVTILPCASAYVGADILAGVVASDFQNKEHSSIFVDIGTNGEIVAISKGKMAATSTAAGPALEGMNISCGCRAEEGAIDSFSISEDFNISYTTIGNCEAKGICGSGLIDIAAALVNRKIILKSGKLNKNLDERVKDRLVDKKFYLTDKIYISQKDIRQIQLAKGAIASGITMLLKEIGISIDEVEEAVIAGAFGYHINGESIKTIGIIPKGFKGKVTFVGNSSVEGARLALINKGCLSEMQRLKGDIKILELSTDDDFQKHFIKELNF
ncbi:ASKHA domain-containing protein [Haloimpatiens sp. FM7330]|uniref:ASKHA domain-containing protein n=1 Tax=Haloimpatiens sp. FM7330 TaxID=3298610 RepID=UPI003625433A